MLMLNNGGAEVMSTVPDICKVPSPAGPVPTPFPNIGVTAQAMPIVENVLVSCMPAISVESKILMSNGDQTGVVGGVESNMIMGDVAFTMSSETVMVGGMPALMQGNMTTHNMENTVGMASLPPPGQIFVTVNS